MTPLEADELRALAEAYVAGEISPGQLETLEGRLRGNEDARLFFLAYLEVHAGLAWESRGMEFEVPKLDPKVVEFPSGEPMSSRASFGFRWVLPLAAAILLFASLAAVWFFSRPHPAPVLAVVKASLHGQWANGSEVTAGVPLHAGVWELQNGLVELETSSGTVLLVEAPASVELSDALHARLLSGSVVVRMPKGESGFVVEMPQMRVTDLGTEFGVSVMPNGESRVQVYEGEVLAEAGGASRGQKLEAGETLLCSAGGQMTSAVFSEDRFIRRFPPAPPKGMAGGVLYSRSATETVRVTPAPPTLTIDGDLTDWNRAGAFRSACEPPYDRTYFVEGMMMYDREHLYLAAHVGDPEPMRNATRDQREFAGGSVIVRVSTDRALGWPLKGTTKEVRARLKAGTPLPDSLNDRVASIIMWHDARSNQPRVRLQHGFDFREETAERPGWRGAFRKDADGHGYTLEYAIPWELLRCDQDPPLAGDTLAALWMVHWSDEEGKVCRGQLVDVTNHHPQPLNEVPPYIYFQNGPSWGRAVYLPAQ